MSLLLSQVPAGFDPANGFPWHPTNLPPALAYRARSLRALDVGGLFSVPRAGLGAVGFDAVADALKRSGLPANNTSYTVCGWVQYNSATGDDSLIFHSDAAGTGLAIEFKTGVVNIVDTHGFSRPASVGGTCVNGKWYFVALKVNGTTATIYRGDEQTPCINASGTIVAQGGSPIAWLSYTSNPLTGSLALWKLFDAQLADAEIEAERLSYTTVRTANLSAFWALASEADRLADSSGNGNALTANSSGPWQDVPGPILITLSSWLPTYPGPSASLRRPTLRDALTYVALVQAAPTVALDWLPYYADRVWGRPPPARFDPPAVFALDTFAVPPLAWAGPFPDQVARPRRVLEGGPTFLQLVTAAVQLDWLPVYPERARAAARAPAWASPAVVFALDTFPVPALAWAPSYPERVRAAARTPAWDPPAVFALDSFPGPALGWASSYPDRVRARPTPTTRWEPAPVFALDTFAVPPLAWAGVFPDRVGRARRVLEGGPTLVQLVVAATTVQLDWLPPLNQPRRTAPFSLTTAPAVFALDTYAVPALAWAPIFPDRVRSVRRPLDVGRLSSLVQLIVPLPPLTWLPQFPAYVWRLSRPVNEGGLFVRLEGFFQALPFSFGGASRVTSSGGPSTVTEPGGASSSGGSAGAPTSVSTGGGSTKVTP